MVEAISGLVDVVLDVEVGVVDVNRSLVRVLDGLVQLILHQGQQSKGPLSLFLFASPLRFV